MPLDDLPEGQAYHLGNRWWCEDCVPETEGTEVLVPARVRCAGCRTPLGPWRTEELTIPEREASLDPTYITCGLCGSGPAPTNICRICSGGACAQCVRACWDCAQAVCRQCVLACGCGPTRVRCLTCAAIHTQRCRRAALRAARYPAFTFTNDSADETLIASKHVRPAITKKVGRRPIPGVFAVPPVPPPVPRARPVFWAALGDAAPEPEPLPEPDDDD